MNLKKTATITPRKIVCFILFWTIISDTLIAEFQMSSSIQYLNDAAWVVLLLCINKNKFWIRLKNGGLSGVLYATVLYVLICFTSALLNWVDPFLIIWASRNMLRFIVFLWAAVLYLREENVTEIFDKLFVVQIISFMIALYQYFILGLHMDTLGGIFGHGNGAALNTFQAMILAYFLCGFLQKRQPAYKVVTILITSLLIAALAEEKAFFVYLIVVVAGSVIISKPSLKTVIILVTVVCLIPIGIDVLVTVNDSWNLEVLTDIRRAVQYLDTSYGLSRINPFPQIQRRFFMNSLVKDLLGIGFGASENCDAASIFTSDFYLQYAHLQYYDFTHQKKFLETGYLGFGTFLLFLMMCVLTPLRSIIKQNNSDYRLKAFVVFGVIAVMSCWFSGAMIYNDAYIIYFGLAAGLIVSRTKKEENV